MLVVVIGWSSAVAQHEIQYHQDSCHFESNITDMAPSYLSQKKTDFENQDAIWKSIQSGF